jgi:hypothetical protein
MMPSRRSALAACLLGLLCLTGLRAQEDPVKWSPWRPLDDQAGAVKIRTGRDDNEGRGWSDGSYRWRFEIKNTHARAVAQIALGFWKQNPRTKAWDEPKEPLPAAAELEPGEVYEGWAASPRKDGFDCKYAVTLVTESAKGPATHGIAGVFNSHRPPAAKPAADPRPATVGSLADEMKINAAPAPVAATAPETVVVATAATAAAAPVAPVPAVAVPVKPKPLVPAPPPVPLKPDVTGVLLAEAPAAWKARQLRAPKGYEMLAPSDVFVGLDWKNSPPNGAAWVGALNLTGQNLRMAPGNDFAEASASLSAGMRGVFPTGRVLSGRQQRDHAGFGWVVWLSLMDWTPETPYAYPTTAAVFVSGGASLDEAIAEAFRQAKPAYHKLTDQPVRTFYLEAGVAARADYAQYREAGTFTYASGLPYAFFCHLPRTAEAARRYGFTPQIPETPEGFVDYVRSLKAREYLPTPAVNADGTPARPERWGRWGFYNTPRADLPPPVFDVE